MSTADRPKCKDCLEQFGFSIRPVCVIEGKPVPGPRCYTHHKAEVRRQREARHDTRVQAVYGLSAGEYKLLHAYQGGKCAICRRATGKTKNLAVDHDHETNVVRGLLCSRCNWFLGHIRDSKDVALQLLVYLHTPPALEAIGERFAGEGKS